MVDLPPFSPSGVPSSSTQPDPPDTVSRIGTLTGRSRRMVLAPPTRRTPRCPSVAFPARAGAAPSRRSARSARCRSREDRPRPAGPRRRSRSSRGSSCSGLSDAVRLRQSNGMPRYWTMTRPSRRRTCGVAPWNSARYSSAGRLTGPQADLGQPRPDEQAGTRQAAQRRRVLGLRFASGPLCAVVAQARRLVPGDLLHPGQEVGDERELRVGVAADLVRAGGARPGSGSTGRRRSSRGLPRRSRAGDRRDRGRAGRSPTARADR